MKKFSHANHGSDGHKRIECVHFQKIFPPIVLLVFTVFLLSSCGGSRKTITQPTPPLVIEKPEVKPEPVVETPDLAAPIREVTEKLVPIAEVPPAPNQYFVILGSFINHNNALNFQEIIHRDGFKSVLLRNDKGFYRVSILSTNDIVEARNEIRRIRANYTRYSDVWLLIQEK